MKEENEQRRSRGSNRRGRAGRAGRGGSRNRKEKDGNFKKPEVKAPEVEAKPIKICVECKGGVLIRDIN